MEDVDPSSLVSRPTPAASPRSHVSRYDGSWTSLALLYRTAGRRQEDAQAEAGCREAASSARAWVKWRKHRGQSVAGQSGSGAAGGALSLSHGRRQGGLDRLPLLHRIKPLGALGNMRSQVPTQTWLNSIYKVKQKWAECFMKNAFTLGMRSTQLSESLNNDLKHHLKSDLDIVRFFQHFERAVQVKRDVEINSEFDSRKYLPKIRMKTPMLVQVSSLYTPVIFEFFQKEYQRSIAACAEALDGQYVYMVKIGYPFEQPIFQEEWKVKGNRLEQKASCDCGQFERLGVLCAHALKALDLMNIKLLPEHYILKRWTREARAGIVQDSHGRIVVADLNVDALHRTNFLSHKFYNLVTEASNSEDCCVLIENTLDNLSKEVKQLLSNAQVTPATSNIVLNAQVTTTTSNDLLAIARLKKKEVNKEGKTSKRRKSWTERQYKAKKIGPATTTAPLSKGQKQKKKKVNTQENHSVERTLQEDSQGYDHIANFTELLNMPSSVTSIGEGIF